MCLRIEPIQLKRYKETLRPFGIMWAPGSSLAWYQNAPRIPAMWTSMFPFSFRQRLLMFTSTLSVDWGSLHKASLGAPTVTNSASSSPATGFVTSSTPTSSAFKRQIIPGHRTTLAGKQLRGLRSHILHMFWILSRDNKVLGKVVGQSRHRHCHRYEHQGLRK